MNATLSLPPLDDLDTQMRKVAQNLAMDIYPLDQILSNVGVDHNDFEMWKHHPRFLNYLKTEREAWTSANNVAERTKLKAGVIMEDFMDEAYRQLHDKKQPLNHRVELGKLVAKIAGMGEPKLLNTGNGATFQLQINLGPGTTPTTIQPTFGKVINHDDPPPLDASVSHINSDLGIPEDFQ